MTRPTEISAFIGDLNGGTVEESISKILSEAALSTVNHGKASKVVLTFDITQIAESQQVKVAHKLNYKMPTATGSVSEDTTTNTPFYVNKGGRMTIFPENQVDMFSSQKHTERSE